MKKKKVLCVIAGCVVALVLVMAIVPLFLVGKVEDIVRQEGGKLLKGQFDFESLDISLFRDFPRASVALNGFYLAGADEFKGDTLVKAGRAAVSVDVLSLLSDNFRIERVALENARVHAIVLEDGRANWDVVKTDTAAVQEPEEETSASGGFGLELRRLSVEDLDVVFDDYQSGLHASVEGFTASCSGDFSSDQTDVSLSAAIEALSLRMGLVPYVADAEIETDIDLTADLANSKFTLRDNRIRINALETSVDGWVAFPDSSRTEMDLKLNTNEIGFKELLSLVPAIYSKEFAELKTEGTASLDVEAKGAMAGDSLVPAFRVALQVKDASLRYPSLPAGVDKIQISAEVSNPGGSPDATVVKIAPLSLQMAGVPFALNATVKTPVSDPDFNLQASGKLDLSNIQKVYPLEQDTKLTGVLTADVQMQGRLSYVEKEQFDRFQAKGTLDLQNLLLHTEGMDEVKVNRSLLTFSPKQVSLSQTELLIGKNDLAVEGALSNYLGYLLKGQTLKGSLGLTSSYLNLNDFMSGTSTEGNAPEETAAGEKEPSEAEADSTAGAFSGAGSVIEVPRNIDFQMTTALKKVLFDQMTLEDIQGKLAVQGGTVDMQGLSLKTMGGTVRLNGSYSTAKSVKQPEMSGAFQLDGLSFSQAYKELNVIRSLAPIFEKLQGNFSGSMNLSMVLDETLSPVTESMNGGGTLSTKDVNLSDIEILKKVATACNRTDLLAQNVKDLDIHFNLVNGKLITEPFTIRLGDKYSLKLEGTTSLDKAIDYTGTIALPGGENSLLSSVNLKIGGTFSSPKISVDTKSMAKEAISSVAGNALEAVGNKLGIDLSDAEKQKEALVAEAKKAGDKLIAAAQKQADDLLSKAEGKPLREIAAKKSGEALVNAAKEQAAKLVAEAEKQGDALIEKAKSAQ